MDLNNKMKNVLIISRGFKAGDAITTLNLFSEWPKENLYCASLVGSEYTKDVAEFYFLGNKEVTYSFPFKYISHPAKSDIGTKNYGTELIHKSLIKNVYQKIVRPLMQRLDFYETRLSIDLSPEFEEWIKKIDPSAIYTSIGDIPTAEFILKIKDRFPEIKIIIHGFDDWLTPSYKIVYPSKHRAKADKLLKKILDISSGFLTSCEKMANEYHDRYGYQFTVFTNPAKITKITKTKKTNNEVQSPSVVFTGKIGWHNNIALKDMIEAVEQINRQGKILEFNIYTDTSKEQINYFLGKLTKSTHICPSVPNHEIPMILSLASAVFLPITIDEKTKKFTRYSMSTKMGEYLASGSPMIYYGPEDIAMTEFLQDKNCSINVTSRGVNYLKQALINALNNNNDEMLDNARLLADKVFNIDIVSKNFKQKIIEIL